MKSKCIVIICLLSLMASPLFAHRITNVSFQIVLLKDRTFQIKGKLNLAFLFAYSKMEQYVVFDKTYRDVLKLPNDQYFAFLNAHHAELIQHFRIFDQNEVVDLQLEINPSGRVPPDMSSLPFEDSFFHDETLQNEFVLKGKIDKLSDSIDWENGWPFLYHGVEVIYPNGETQLLWIASGEKQQISLKHIPISSLAVISNYFWQGLLHIIPLGLDHVLFILGIFFLSTQLKMILLQATLFTIAHSLTLVLTVFGFVNLSGDFIEPVIAFSIAYVGIENIFFSKIGISRYLIIFVFGLIHGMGFAGALAELGIPQGQYFMALLFFNLGVEAGQVLVILGAFLLLGIWFWKKPWYRQRIVIPISALIAVYALFLGFERMLS